MLMQDRNNWEVADLIFGGGGALKSWGWIKSLLEYWEI